MLLRVNLISTSQMITHNYKYLLSTVIYDLIREQNKELADKIHSGSLRRGDGKPFKPFVFSDLIFEKQTNIRQGKKIEGFGSFFLGTTNGDIYDIISSLTNKKILISNKEVYLSHVEKIDLETETNYFYSKSPILAKITNNKLQQFLKPTDERYISALKRNLINKYAEVTGKLIMEDDFSLKVIHVNGEILEKYKNERFYKGYYCTFELIGPTDLKEVALKLGIGIYNCQGFGMIYPVKGFVE